MFDLRVCVYNDVIDVRLDSFQVTKMLMHTFLKNFLGRLDPKRLFALFRCLGSKHIRKLPSCFSTIAMELTQSVGFSTFLITPRLSMSSSSALTLSRRAAGMVLGEFMTGVTAGSTSIW